MIRYKQPKETISLLKVIKSSGNLKKSDIIKLYIYTMSLLKKPCYLTKLVYHTRDIPIPKYLFGKGFKSTRTQLQISQICHFFQGVQVEGVETCWNDNLITPDHINLFVNI